MKKLSKMIIKHRLIIMVVIVGVTVFLGFEATKIKVNPDIVSYFPDSDPAVRVFDNIGKHFGGNQIAMVAVNSSNLFTPKMIEELVKVTDSLSSMDGIDNVVDLTNIIDITSDKGGISIRKMVDASNTPETRAAVDSLKNRLKNNPMYIGTVISRDFHTALILCRISDKSKESSVANQILGVVKRNISGARIYTGGVPFLLLAINRSILHDIKLLVPILTLVMILILFISYGSLKGVVLPILSVGVSIVWTIGTMVLLGKDFTILSDIIPVVLLAVGSAYSIHILSRFEELKTEKMSNRERTIMALSDVFLPVSLAALTTMIGFVSFLFGSFFNMIKEFGIFSSLGVFVAFVTSVLIVPILLSYIPDHQESDKRIGKSSHRNLLINTNKIILRHEMVGLFFALVVLVMAFVGIFFIERKVSYADYFGKNSMVRRSETLISKEFGGSSVLEIVARGNPKSPMVLKKIYDLENYLKSIKNVNNANSIADIIVKINKVISGSSVIPISQMKINNLWFLIDGEKIVDNMVDLNDEESLIQASLNSDLSIGETRNIIDKIERYIKNNSGESVKFYLTGMPVINLKLDNSIVKSQIWSLIFAFIAVLVVLIFLTGSFIKGIIGVIPVAFTLILIFGVMGIFKIPLDIATALVGSISIGIGIDYSIHFIERFEKEIKSNDKIVALENTLNGTGKAIFINMLVVVAGFCVLVFADLIPLRRFGILISITMLGSAFGTTVILPSVFMSTGKNIYKKEAKDV